MTESRLNKLAAMLTEDPDDTLLKYMLAMELDKASDHEASLKLLAELMHEDPPYVPAFLMAGQQHAAIGQPDQARTIWRAGIDAARRQQNEHAASEMSQFLQDMT